MNKQIYEEASEWFVNHRVGDTDDAARRKFDAWLRASPQHVAAYLEVAAIWNEGPSLDRGKSIDVDALIALAASESPNVVSLAATRATGETSGSRASGARRRHHVRQLGVAAAVLISTLAGILGWMYTQRGVYTTDIGEQRSVQLVDGSTIDINTRSSIRVRFEDEERRVELLEGQALFRVAKDPARPFVVASGTARIRAVGTQFEVYRHESGTTVTVLEGRVALDGGQLAYVRAGEQVDIKPGIAPEPKPANLEIAAAWTKRQIVFDSATLEEVAEEFNRYNRRQLVVDNRGDEEFHITGVFSSTDPASLIRFLRERQGIVIQETDKEIHITRE